MTTMNSRYLAPLRETHGPVEQPTVRGSEYELINERQYAAEQARLEERDEMRRRFSGEREKRGYDAYREHGTLWQEGNVR